MTNPDYSETAVNLCNPTELKNPLEQRKNLQDKITDLEGILDDSDIYKQLLKTRAELSELDQKIKVEIDNLGSYQDIDAGLYALKQIRVSIYYNPELVKKQLPKFAPAVIEENVNKKAFEGLLKGNLITQAEAEAVAVKRESFAYIIRS